MKVAGLQYDIVWEDRAANFRRLVPKIDEAVGAGARLIVLPEMFSVGFSMDTDRIAEPEDGASAGFLVEQAQRAGVWICGSAPELSPGELKPANTLILAGPQGEVSRYRKLHPFTYAREDRHYSAGADLVTVDVEGLRCTFFICYDLRFADEFWTTAERTDAYIVVANWPDTRRAHWSTLLRARAIENLAYVVGVNRVGRAARLNYAGDSAIHDPWGEPLATASHDETLLLAELDPARVREARERFSALQDRRSGAP